MVIFCATVLGPHTSTRALGLCAVALVPVAVLQIVGAIKPLSADRADAPLTIAANAAVLLALAGVMLLILRLVGREPTDEAAPALEPRPAVTTTTPKRVRTLSLSERERDVAQLVAAGLQTKPLPIAWGCRREPSRRTSPTPARRAAAPIAPN